MLMLTFLALIVILYVRNQYSSVLLTNSTYGMPALIKQGHIENLYIGSSMFRQGIDIMALEEKNPGSNYILAYNGNQPVLEYYELKKLIDNGVIIDNLYVDMYVYSAWAEPKISDEKLLFELNNAEKWNLWNLCQADDSTPNLESLWRMFITSNNELLLTWPISNVAVNSQFYRGGSLNQATNSNADILNASAIQQIGQNMNMLQEDSLNKLIDLAQANQINIVFVETPKYQSVEKDSSYIEAMQIYVTLLEEKNVSYLISDMLSEYIPPSKNGTYYTFEHNKSLNYSDTLHMSNDGKKIFTKLLLYSKLCH